MINSRPIMSGPKEALLLLGTDMSTQTGFALLTLQLWSLGGWLCENCSARLVALSNGPKYIMVDCTFVFSRALPAGYDLQSGGVIALDEA